MVKGVNKTVIEVNNTGNKFFEKIVFYVTPEYGNLSAKQLRQAAESFSFNFEKNISHKASSSFRKRYKRKQKFKFLAFFGGGCVALGVALALIL